MDGILVAIADPEQILQTLSWLEGALKETFTISTCAPGPDAERVSLSNRFDLIILDGGSDVEIIRAQQSVINGSPPVIVAWIAQSHLKPVDGADVCWESTMSHVHMLDSLANVLTFGGTQVVPSDEKPAERREAYRQGPHTSHRIGRKGWHSFSKAVSEKSVSPLQRLQWFFKKRGPLRTNNGLPSSSLLGANGVAACVVGCGMMGVAISGELMRRGCTVRLFDYLHSARRKAVQRIQTNVHRLNATGVLAPDDAARIMPRCGVAETLSDAISGAVLIIEAICDDRNAKRTLHAEMAEALAELRADLKRVVICSTSAILSPHTVLTSVSSQYGERVVHSVFHYPCWFVDEVDFRGEVDVGPGWQFALRIFNQLGFRAVHVRQQGAHAPPSRAACESIAHAPAPLAASSAEEAAGESSEPSASESKMGCVSEAAGKNLRRARLKATQAVLVSEPFKSFQRCLSTRSTVAASSNEPVAGLETGLEAGLEASLGQSACRWATAMQRKLSIEWAVVSKVVNSVRTVQPKVYAELVGSYMAGTQTAFSDYDLVLIGCSLPEDQLARLLAQQLPCRRGWSIVEGTTQVIRGTVTTAQGEKWVDIVLPQVDVHGSFRSAVLVSSILCPGMAMLLPVVLVVKHLLFACQLGSSAAQAAEGLKRVP